MCEHGIETHLAEHPFLRFGDGHEPLIRKGGVYFVKAQTVNAIETMTQDESEKRCVRAEDSQNSQNRCVQAEDSQKWCVRAEDSQNWCIGAEDSQNSQNRCVRTEGFTKVRRTS